MVLLQVSDCSSIDVDKVWGSIPRIVGLIKKQPNNPIYWSYLVDEVEKTAERIEAQLK
ncbi:MAG: hypothetical protein Q8P23_00740 [bacterium]|nr:hypothetical protein [bacterium]